MNKHILKVILSIFVLFLSKEFIYVNEEFFVILCFLLFVVAFVVGVSDLVRDSFDSAISEIKSTLSSGIYTYQSSLNAVFTDLQGNRDAFLGVIPALLSSLEKLSAEHQVVYIKNASPLIKGYLAQSILLASDSSSESDVTNTVNVSPFISSVDFSTNPNMHIEKLPDNQIFSSLPLNVDVRLLLLLNALIAKSLV